jgi:hypothetical protein
MKLYIACPLSKREIGGKIPYASQVKKKMFLGFPPILGSFALLI